MTTTADQWTEPLVIKLIKRNGGHPPERIIEDYARGLLAEAGQDGLPIDVDGIASLQGIKRRLRSADFAGRIYADESGQLLMDLNADDSDSRQRFTVAHELMHTAFPGFRKESRYRLDHSVGGHSRTRAEEEYLCDLGAAALLMPRDIVARDFSLESGLGAVEALADGAQVSLEAAGNRLVALADQPWVFLVLDKMHKPADARQLRRGEPVPEKLRVRYGTVQGMNLHIPRYKSVDEDGVLALALETPLRIKGVGTVPGAGPANEFAIEAKGFPYAGRSRVLALARPVATAGQ
jgi:Zn-dependent peptidase ImmA (M78 family)